MAKPISTSAVEKDGCTTVGILLAIWLPGLGLVLFSIYTLVTVLSMQITWTKTQGTITGEETRWSKDKSYVYEKAVFTDASGKTMEVVATRSAGTTTANLKREGTVTIYYNPTDSSDAELFSWSYYLPVLFLPFGWLLMFLGNPFPRKQLINK